MNTSPIADLVQPIRRADPTVFGATKIKYIDIASIDRETKDVIGASCIDAASAPSRARQQLITNDVLISTVRPNLNGVAIVPAHLDGSIGSTGFCVLRANTKHLRPDYLFYFSQTASFVSRLTRIADGANYPAVSDEDVLETAIPLPALEEQRRIAQVLRDVDRLRRMRRHAIFLSDELRFNSFREALGTLQPKPAALGEICVKITDGVHVTPTYVAEGVPFLRVTDIQSSEIDWSSVKRIKREEYCEITRRVRAEIGDVLYSKNGTIGVAKEITWDQPFAHFVSLALLKPNRRLVNPTFLTTWLNTPDALQQATGHSKKLTVTNLHLNEIGKIQVPLPSIRNQESLVTLIGATSKLLAAHVEALRQADHLFQTLLRQAFKQC
jgi:type I restriction enzyme, S subunit